MYVVNANDYLFALSQKCPHLGCHVPYCESSGRFECPCHGSIYDLAGEYITGPAPRGMDRYEVTLDGDNVVVDTSVLERRPAARRQASSSRHPRARAASARPDVPRERPEPPPFEPEWLERSLNRYLAWGLVFMVLLLVGFVAYRVREPGLRRAATRAQTTSYTAIGQPDLQRELRAVPRQGRDRRRKRADPELEPVPQEHLRRPDLRAGRRAASRAPRCPRGASTTAAPSPTSRYGRSSRISVRSNRTRRACPPGVRARRPPGRTAASLLALSTCIE